MMYNESKIFFNDILCNDNIKNFEIQPKNSILQLKLRLNNLKAY